MRYALICSLFAFLLVSCASAPKYVESAPRQTNELTLIGIAKDVVRGFQKRINLNGLLEVELVLRSSSTRDVIYKVTWLDSDGFALNDPLSAEYQYLTLVGGRDTILKKIASDVRAKDFSIEIQKR